MNSLCLKPYHAYSNSFSSSNVGKFFWSWILKTVSKFRKRKGKFLSHVFTSSTKSEIRHFHVVVAQRRQRNVQKSMIRGQRCCINQSEPIAFFPFSLPSPPSLLKLPHEGLLRMEVGLCKAPYMTQGVSPVFFFFFSSCSKRSSLTALKLIPQYFHCFQLHIWFLPRKILPKGQNDDKWAGV